MSFQEIDTELTEPNLKVSYVSEYDGRELFVADKLLIKTKDGSVVCLSTKLRDCIIEFLGREDYVLLPANWLLFYRDLQLGLNVHEGLRKAVFDVEIAYRQYRLPNIKPPSQDRRIGISGLDLRADIVFREPEDGDKPTTIAGWEKLANRKRKVKVYKLDLDELFERMDASDGEPERQAEIISALIEENRREHKAYDPRLNQGDDQAEKDRVASIRKGKKLLRKDIMNRSRDSSTGEDDGFKEVVSPKKVKEKKRDIRKRVPDAAYARPKVPAKPTQVNLKVETARVVKVTSTLNMKAPSTEGAAGSGLSKSAIESIRDGVSTKMQHIIANAKLAPTRRPDPLEGKPDKPVEKTEELGGKPNEPGKPKEVGEGDEPMEEGSEEASDRLKSIWRNAKLDFSEFVPASFEECALGPKAYGCPRERNRNGESDDEDWLRDTVQDDPTSDHLERWFDQLRYYPETYYQRDQKWKLNWAYKQWYVIQKERICPFGICYNRLHGRPVYPTARRFLRHLCEGHLHHTIVYECETVQGQRKSEMCVGLITTRRANMVRHYKTCHSPGMEKARTRVLKLHDLLMSHYMTLGPSDYKEITARTDFYLEVRDGPKSKLSARIALVKAKGKFDMPQKFFDDVCTYRGDPPRPQRLEEKRQASQSPARGDDKRYRDSFERPSRNRSPHFKVPDSRLDDHSTERRGGGGGNMERSQQNQYQSPLNRPAKGSYLSRATDLVYCSTRV